MPTVRKVNRAIAKNVFFAKKPIYIGLTYVDFVMEVQLKNIREHSIKTKTEHFSDVINYVIECANEEYPYIRITPNDLCYLYIEDETDVEDNYEYETFI
jgi:hypothetical protein